MISPETKDVLEALAYVATIIGIPVAILAFLSEKRKERGERERVTYVEANSRYVDYLTLCLAHPDLDVFDLSKDDPEVIKSGLDVRKLAMFTILISSLETGYVLYADQREDRQLHQWQGWHDYMAMWVARTDFRAAWPVLSPQFDVMFVRYMESMISDASKAQLSSST